MKIDNQDLLRQRRALFAGAPVEYRDLGETVERLAAAAGGPTVAQTLKSADRLLIQPRSGVSDHAGMIGLLQALAHADIGSITIDSYTRQNLWDQARAGVNLNGYPLVTRGSAHGRELAGAVPIPVEVRHGSPDGRLLAEVTFASGITSFEGGGISYTLPYSKDRSLADALRHWQYIDRLTGWLTEASGVVLDRETFGTLTAVLVPPAISLICDVLEYLLAIEQGVKSVTVSYPESGHFVQDVAALELLPALCREYGVRVFGTSDIAIHTALHQWMGVFPKQRAAAVNVIGFGVLSGVVGGATKLINKTYEEAHGLPSAAANARSIAFCQDLVLTLKRQPELVYGLRKDIAGAVEAEKDLIATEVRDVLDAVLSEKPSDLAGTVAHMFTTGVLDIPFPANRDAQGRVLPARDRTGAIRILDYGGLPVRRATRQRSADLLGRHTRFDYREVMADISYVADGRSWEADCTRREALSALYADDEFLTNYRDLLVPPSAA